MDHPTGKVSIIGCLVTSLFAVMSWTFNTISEVIGWSGSIAITGIFSMDEWVKIGQMSASFVAVLVGVITGYYTIRNNRRAKKEKKQ